MATRKTKPTIEQRPMACVQLGGLDEYMLPFADAQRLVAIMANAVSCRRQYRSGDGWLYEVDQPHRPVDVELRTVHPGQVVPVRSEPGDTPGRSGGMPGHEPLEITGPAR